MDAQTLNIVRGATMSAPSTFKLLVPRKARANSAFYALRNAGSEGATR
jgi:hypothetical protein